MDLISEIMIYVIAFVLFTYMIGLTVWVYYLVAMKLKYARDNYMVESKFLLFNAYLVLIIGAPIYLFLNIVVATIIFVDLPRELQFTKRCQRYIKGETGWFEITRKWRKKAATYICRVLLDPFDEGSHC